MTADASVTDLVAMYDELVLAGTAPEPEKFCAEHSSYPELLTRLQRLAKLRGDLSQLFSAPQEDTASVTLPTIPGFRVIRPIGKGGMGSVYLAEQQNPKRLCALKRLNQTLPAALDRFRREADLAARLDHPGIATVYAFGVEGTQAFLATEMLHGFSLRALLMAADSVSPENPSDWFIDAVWRVSEGIGSDGPPTATAPVAAIVKLATEIADALAHAHGRGVIHRDVKPSNIIVTLDGRAKLIDFGIAVAAEEPEERLTRTGTFIGSHGYAAPEQLRGEHEQIGPWTDTYALGATLFEMLTQRTPFEAPTYADRLARVSESPTHGPRHFNRKVPHALDALVMRALHPEPGQRFHDGEELAEALRACPVRPPLLPGLPTHLLARWVPRTTAQLLAVVATVTACIFAYLYHDESHQAATVRAQYRAAERIVANAALDHAVVDQKELLESCLVHDRRIDGGVSLARFVADLTIVSGMVSEIAIVSSTARLGVRAQQCLMRRLEELELSGVGLVEPVILRLDIRVAPNAALPP